MTPATVLAGGINFGDISMYSGGAFIPEGNYCLYFYVMQYQPTDKTTGAPKGKSNLGVMIHFYPLSNPTEEAKLEKFYSMGQKADESFAPNPDTGKGVVLIPGAKGQTFNDKTNWFLFLNSLMQSGLPPGVFTNDATTIDGVWVHIASMDEPAERSTYAKATSEVALDADRKPGKIAVVTEILEGGAPWEGGGGLPAAPVEVAAPAAVAPRAATPVARPVAAPAAARPATVAPRAAAAPPTPRPVAPRPPAAAAHAPIAPSAVANEDVRTHAINAVGDVLASNLNGISRVALRTSTFASAEKKVGQEIAGQIINEFFEPAGQANLENLLGEMGYKIVGPMVKPA
jgi:hypothetical protein